MAKLVATYAAGMFAVFTENRTGMQQRALIDIGDSVPTPEAMANLAGSMADQWGWTNVIVPSKAHKALPSDNPRKYTQDKNDPPSDRAVRIVEFLKANPGMHDTRQIVKGCGFEDTESRLAKWQHTFGALLKANAVISELVIVRKDGHTHRKRVYSIEP